MPAHSRLTYNNFSNLLSVFPSSQISSGKSLDDCSLDIEKYIISVSKKFNKNLSKRFPRNSIKLTNDKSL